MRSDSGTIVSRSFAPFPALIWITPRSKSRFMTRNVTASWMRSPQPYSSRATSPDVPLIAESTRGTSLRASTVGSLFGARARVNSPMSSTSRSRT